MFLAFDIKNGVKYAKWLRSVRVGGTVRHEYVNIGLVLDERRRIFRNRQRGVFTFDPQTGEYGPVPADFVPPPAGRRGPERLILDFGDAYVLDAFLAASGLRATLDAIGYGNPDTLRAMLAHYVLCGMAACHAASWWEGSYARLLWPRADLRSQRISEFLAALGSETLQRRFFAAYLDAVHGLVRRRDDGKGKGKTKALGSVLIDSTGLPNSIRFPLTAVSNHNGKVGNEVRLIYVLHRGSGLPLYFRCCPGNVVDVSTLVRTLAELDELGIAPEEAILDAGYYDLENLGELYGRGIAFVTRLGEHLALHKDLMAAHLGSVMRRGNLVRFNERYVYVKRVPCKPDGVHDGWAYLGLDPARKRDEEEKLFARAGRCGMDAAEVHDAMAAQGTFTLLSSKRLAPSDILPTYYARQQIEQVFDLGKNYAPMLPLRVQSEEALRGHLLLTFVATAVFRLLQERLECSPYNPQSMFQNLRNQKCKVYDRQIIPQEPAKKANDAYKLLDIPSPAKLPRPDYPSM